MDIFNKKKMAKLERQLSLKEAECSSLKSDLAFLERENDELKTKLGTNVKVVASVKSSEPTLIKDAKSIRSSSVNSVDRQTQTSNQTVESKASDLLLTGAMGGLMSSAIINSFNMPPNLEIDNEESQ
ncbi:hypothetical protein [Pseudoalteromonas sp. SR41-6]|uniref:hypothetical protein n=1 Tax=Pseudoalteromonas sp. SR41-6 TaxID=2760948 RepID=UPI0016046BB6|nr:hypothetical protein [Pseudoalteromonas sp. SR41-6]MBB1333950.1 hypothetical protein [Pseudoalteromonas sp. SR41-6]